MDPYLTAQISASAIQTNLKLIKSVIGPRVKVCPSVKTNAYGHGLDLLHGIIAQEADWLSVACPAEAVALRQKGYAGPLLMFFSMGAYSAKEGLGIAQELLEANVTQTVWDMREVCLIGEAAQQLGQEAQVHLKIDTGMGRSGAIAQDAFALVKAINDQPGVRLTGIYTHFASADMADKTFAQEQLDVFQKAVEACPLDDSVLCHAANSAAILCMPEAHLDMVRPGIAVYGYQPSDEVGGLALPLVPALRLMGPLLQIKKVPAGTCCGYGGTFTFDRPSVLGRVPIGYGDGYLRSLSNRSMVSIRGKLAPVRGRVSMDQIVVDLTDLPALEVGQEVEIISPNPTARHSAENLARLSDTIVYEITCRLGGPRIKYVLVD